MNYSEEQAEVLELVQLNEVFAAQVQPWGLGTCRSHLEAYQAGDLAVVTLVEILELGNLFGRAWKSMEAFRMLVEVMLVTSLVEKLVAVILRCRRYLFRT